jgi:hypothetical protein
MDVPINHLPNWLQRALQAPHAVKVRFSDASYVTVDANSSRYASDIQDWAASSVFDDEVKVIPLPGAKAESHDQPLSRLAWAVTLARLQSQTLATYDYRYSVFRLESWPCLTHLPEDVVPVVARVCALLARKPTTASLIHLALGMSEEQVVAVIEALRLHEHISTPGGANAAAAPGASQSAVAAPNDEVKPSENSLIGKIWQRLGIRS